MGVAAHDDPLSISDGDGGMKSPPTDIRGGFAVSCQIVIRVFDPLLEEKIFILLFDKKKGLSFLDQGKRGRDRDICGHFGFKVKESPGFVNPDETDETESGSGSPITRLSLNTC